MRLPLTSSRWLSQMVLAYGDPALAHHIRFSEQRAGGCPQGHQDSATTCCTMWNWSSRRWINRLLYQEPLGFLGRASVISHAKTSKQTRAMTAVDCWKPYMAGGIVLIGQSGTALFRLLEILKDGVPRLPW